MASMCKILRSGAIMRLSNKSARIFVNCMSDKSGCDDGKDSGKSVDNESKVCPVCHCSDCGSCCPPMYNCRKYSHCLPGCTRMPCGFDPVPNAPTDIFRCTTREAMGPGGQACKTGSYPNPEYFSYHHMSYYDMHLMMSCCRQLSPQTGRKP